MFWKTERNKLITAFIVVGGLYGAVMLLANMAQSRNWPGPGNMTPSCSSGASAH